MPWRPMGRMPWQPMAAHGNPRAVGLPVHGQFAGNFDDTIPLSDLSNA